MKIIKKILIGAAAVPFVLAAMLIGFEIFGMAVNHAATGIQTRRVRRDLMKALPDCTVTDVYSRTGNTSGTGNHVDCLTVISFTEQAPLKEIEQKVYAYYDYNMWNCYVEAQEAQDAYRFVLCTRAPFADNIEGH